MDDIRSYKTFTLCWDCANATGGCSWADRLKPVKGWGAKYVEKKGDYNSYFVYDCPQFERDATYGGAEHYKEKNK